MAVCATDEHGAPIELAALEESLQNDPANFGTVAMQRMSDLAALRDAAAMSA